MIKITGISADSAAATIDLAFSDGSHGRWPAVELLATDTVLTRPLADPAFFARAFIEAGALAWPNGLELSAWTLQAELRERGLLVEARAA